MDRLTWRDGRAGTQRIAPVGSHASAVLPARVPEFPVHVYRPAGRGPVPQSSGPGCHRRLRDVPRERAGAVRAGVRPQDRALVRPQRVRGPGLQLQGLPGFHFYPTYGYVELLPSEIEGCQRVVASSFNRLGTQFVRYDTGDLAVNPVGSCATNNFPRASAIVGRSQETFLDTSGRRRSLFGYAFGDLDHGAFWDQIRDIQFVQDKAGFLLVRMVTNPNAERKQIQRTFEQRIPMAKLEFEYVSVIERSPSGKRRYFVDGLRADVTGQH